MKKLFVVLVNHVTSTLLAMILIGLNWALSLLSGGGLLFFLQFDSVFIVQLVSDYPQLFSQLSCLLLVLFYNVILELFL
jgi:hypothetical protein